VRDTGKRMEHQVILSVRGGAGFRWGKTGNNRSMASWPFGRLAATSKGLTVRTLFESWSAIWDDLDHAGVLEPPGPLWRIWGRGVILVPKQGHQCLFSTYDTSAYRELVQLLDDHHVSLIQNDAREFRRRMKQAR